MVSIINMASKNDPNKFRYGFNNQHGSKNDPNKVRYSYMRASK